MQLCEQHPHRSAHGFVQDLQAAASSRWLVCICIFSSRIGPLAPRAEHCSGLCSSLSVLSKDALIKNSGNTNTALSSSWL